MTRCMNEFILERNTEVNIGGAKFEMECADSEDAKWMSRRGGAVHVAMSATAAMALMA